jgi:hypothetical protein
VYEFTTIKHYNFALGIVDIQGVHINIKSLGVNCNLECIVYKTFEVF